MADKRKNARANANRTIAQAHTSRVSCVAPRRRLQFNINKFETLKIRKTKNNHFVYDERRVRHPISKSFSH